MIPSASLIQGNEFERLSTQKLLEILNTGLLFERGRALFILGRRSSQDENLILRVVEEITDSKNRNARTVGTVSISFLGIAGLLEAGTSNAQEAVQKLLETWPEPDCSHLLDFLKSASLI